MENNEIIIHKLNRIEEHTFGLKTILNVEELSDYTIKIPHTLEMLSPILTTIPLQMLAYHLAVLRGCNVDQPRNLAKSVTVG